MAFEYVHELWTVKDSHSKVISCTQYTKEDWGKRSRYFFPVTSRIETALSTALIKWSFFPTYDSNILTRLMNYIPVVSVHVLWYAETWLIMCLHVTTRTHFKQSLDMQFHPSEISKLLLVIINHIKKPLWNVNFIYRFCNRHYWC